jgi:hypothetical protein
MSTEAPEREYSRETITDGKKLAETRREIGSERTDKEKGYDKTKPEGRKKLSEKWMAKANLSEVQRNAINEQLGIKPDDSEEVQDEKRKKWQRENELEDDGILWWKTLERLDTQITKQVTQNDDSLSSDSELNGLQYIESEYRVQAEKLAKEENTEKLQQVLTLWYSQEGLADNEGNGLNLTQVDGENILEGTWNNSGKYYNVDTETYETKDERAARLEWEETKKQNETITGIGEESLDALADREALGIIGTKLRDTPLNKVANLKPASWFQNSRLTPEQVTVLKERITPLLEKHPELGKMTLGQYQQLIKEPTSFATSALVPKDGTPVDPKDYGIESDYKYAQDSTGRQISIPKSGANMDTIKVTGNDGTPKSQRQWLEWIVGNNKAEIYKEYPVPGSPELRFQKTALGRVDVYEAGKMNTPLMVYEKRIGQANYEWQNIADTQAVSDIENISFVNPTISKPNNIT